MIKSRRRALAGDRAVALVAKALLLQIHRDLSPRHRLRARYRTNRNLVIDTLTRATLKKQ
jgi:hypothetical protein